MSEVRLNYVLNARKLRKRSLVETDHSEPADSRVHLCTVQYST
jgi:hypothetical protein